MADSYVCSGATMKCTMGTNTAKLTVLPSRTVYLTGKPMANISDHLTMVNLAPFGRCRSLGFPSTAAATAAHHGHLTPMPCMHNTPFPWMNGKNDYIVKGNPALLKSSTCQCMWGGTISLITDGQSPPSGNVPTGVSIAKRISIARMARQSISEDIEAPASDKDEAYNHLVERGMLLEDAKVFCKAVRNERRKFALKFYEQNSTIKPGKIESHLSGIDFTKPVSIETLPPPGQKNVTIYQYRNGNTDVIGNYYTLDPKATPSDLGIANVYGPDMSPKVKYSGPLIEETITLKSTSKGINDTWSVPGHSIKTKGGATQYFIPKNDAVPNMTICK